ncbi:uncharacterized protein LOC129747228 [Uranotaenia lowii]|uniref:uncharacterized protein LOC129747228 n=1 Tax=Uranotaenia lowii TaxID=190385 RepID=UPI002478D6CA|nr:uncharacterized protein LOC129747228 [Uranotaenia lowii]
MTCLVNYFTLLVLIFRVYSAPIQSGDTKCKIPKNVLDAIQKGMSDISKPSNSVEIPSTDAVDVKCKEDVKSILDTLKKLKEEYQEYESMKNSEQNVEDLKTAFEEKMDQLTKQRDVFFRQSGQENKQEQGVLQDKIHNLKLEIVKIQQEIEQTTKQYWEDVFELMSVMKDDDRATWEKYATEVRKHRMRDYFKHLIVTNADKETFNLSLKYLAGSDHTRAVVDAVVWSLKMTATGSDRQHTSTAKLMLLDVLCWLKPNKNYFSSYGFTLKGAVKPLFSGIGDKALPKFVEESKRCQTDLTSDLNNLRS